MDIESKTVQCSASSQKMYDYLCDFNHFTQMMPPQVEGWSVEGDKCSFKVGGFMQLTLTYTERTPFSRIYIAPASNSSSPIPFKAGIHITEKSADACDVSIHFESDGGNPMMNMMLKPKLKELANMLADRLQYFSQGL